MANPTIFSLEPPFPSLSVRGLAFVLDLFLIGFIQQGIRRGLLGVTLSELPSIELLASISFVYVLSGYWMISSTYAKAILGLRIVDIKSGRRMGFWQSISRTVLMFAGMLIVGLGYFYAVTNPERQSFHDKVAKTLVVFDEA